MGLSLQISDHHTLQIHKHSQVSSSTQSQCNGWSVVRKVEKSFRILLLLSNFQWLLLSLHILSRALSPRERQSLLQEEENTSGKRNMPFGTWQWFIPIAISSKRELKYQGVHLLVQCACPLTPFVHLTHLTCCGSSSTSAQECTGAGPFPASM